MTRHRQSQEQRPAWWDGTNYKAMIICRISDKKQLDGVSLQTQEHHLRDYVERMGLDLAATEPFQESAKNSQRRV
jgi:hypothetical protein